MMDSDGSALVFLLGGVLGLVMSALCVLFIDIVPQEAPMIERCEEFNTTLKSYDHYTATCENGIEFKRSAL